MLRLAQLLVHWPLLLAVDALTKIGSTTHPSEMHRLYIENFSLKAINEAPHKAPHRAQDKRKFPRTKISSCTSLHAPVSLSSLLGPQIKAHFSGRGRTKNRMSITCKFL